MIRYSTSSRVNFPTLISSSSSWSTIPSCVNGVPLHPRAIFFCCNRYVTLLLSVFLVSSLRFFHVQDPSTERFSCTRFIHLSSQFRSRCKKLEQLHYSVRNQNIFANCRDYLTKPSLRLNNLSISSKNKSLLKEIS